MRAHHFVFLSALWMAQSLALTLPTQPLQSYECETCASLSHLNLDTTWTLDNHNPLGHETIHLQKSLKYQQHVTQQELQQGVAIYTTAPGAIIRIVPINKNISASDIQLRLYKGQDVDLPLNEASSLFAENDAVQESAFPDKPLLMLQLKPELGFGEFKLKTATINKHLNDEFIIHVFDKASLTYLNVETDKAHYQYGDELITTIRLHEGVTNYPIEKLDVSLKSATGDIIPLSLEKISRNAYQAHTKLDSAKNSLGQNYYIEADVTTSFGDQTIKRHAHTAFSYTIPSAAIAEITTLKAKPLSFSATINIATGSRYALQAVLFATDAQGKKIPVQSVQSAAWLSPGQSNIAFSFPSGIAHQYKSPYYLGSILLMDFGQLKPVFAYSKLIDIAGLN